MENFSKIQIGSLSIQGIAVFFVRILRSIYLVFIRLIYGFLGLKFKVMSMGQAKHFYNVNTPYFLLTHTHTHTHTEAHPHAHVVKHT